MEREPLLAILFMIPHFYMKVSTRVFTFYKTIDFLTRQIDLLSSPWHLHTIEFFLSLLSPQPTIIALERSGSN